MNPLNCLNDGICVRLAITLAHFLWQAAAVGLLAALMGVLLRKAHASVRYAVFLAALGVMAVCPLITFPLVQAPSVSGSAITKPAGQVTVVTQDVAPSMPDTPSEQPVLPAPMATGAASVVEPVAAVAAPPAAAEPPADYWKTLSPIVASCYALGVGLMFVRLLMGLHGGRRLRRASQPVDDPAILAMLSRQARALGLRFTPAVACCGRVAVPVVVGLLRPMILLPLSITSGLSAGQVEAILAHELAHIRRLDPLVNLLQRLVETFLFFHPAVWYVSRRVRLEREHCCDDLAVSAGAERYAYAASLLHVAQQAVTERGRRLAPAVAVGATDKPSQLRARIGRLIGGPDENVRLTRSWPLAALLVAGVVLAAMLLNLQAAPTDPADVEQAASPPASQPITRAAATADQVVVEDLALQMLVAIRDKDDAALKSLACDHLKGWRDALPQFAMEMRERFRQYRSREFQMYADASLVRGDLAAVRCVDPEAPNAVYLVLFFVRMPDGWKNCSLRNSPPSTPLDVHLERAARELHMELPATGSAAALQGVATLPASQPAATQPTTQHGLSIVQRDAAGNLTASWEAKTWDRLPDGRYRLEDVKLTQYENEQPSRVTIAREAVIDPAGQDWMMFDRVRVKDYTITRYANGRPEDVVTWQEATLTRAEFFGRPASEPADSTPSAADIELGSIRSEAMNFAMQVQPDRQEIATDDGRLRIIVRADDGSIRHIYESDDWKKLPDGTIHTGAMKVTSYTGGERTAELTCERATLTPASPGNERFRAEFGDVTLRQSPATQPASQPASQPAEPVVGRVMDEGGSPVAGAEVFVSPRGQGVSTLNGITEFPETLIVETGEDGQFRVPPQGDEFNVYAFGSHGFGKASAAQLRRGLPVTLRPWARVNGQIVLDGQSVAGADVELRAEAISPLGFPNGGSARYRLETRTDEQGRFEFDRVPPGEIVAVYRAVHIGEGPARSTLPDHKEVLVLEPGETKDVTLGGSGVDVTGWLATPGGRPFDPEGYRVLANLQTPVSLPPVPPELASRPSSEETKAWLERWAATPEGLQYLKCLRAGGRSYAIEVAADGAMLAPDVPPGEYELRVVVSEPAPPEGGIATALWIIETKVEVKDEPVDMGTLTLQPRSQVVFPVASSPAVGTARPLGPAGAAGAPAFHVEWDAPVRVDLVVGMIYDGGEGVSSHGGAVPQPTSGSIDAGVQVEQKDGKTMLTWRGGTGSWTLDLRVPLDATLVQTSLDRTAQVAMNDTVVLWRGEFIKDGKTVRTAELAVRLVPADAGDENRQLTPAGSSGLQPYIAKPASQAPQPASQPAPQPAERTWRGKVLDGQGRQVEGATVLAYQWVAATLSVEVVGSAISGVDGAFSLDVPEGAEPGETDRTISGGFVAFKDGLAADWHAPTLQDDKTEPLIFTLTQPSMLAGVVVDAAGAPIAGADVTSRLTLHREHMSGGERIFKSLTARTDAEGRFEIHGLPAEAQASLDVVAPGYAWAHTRSKRDFEYPAGATDIRIVLPKEATIEGRIVEKATGEGIPGLRIHTHTVTDDLAGTQAGAVSDEAGRFVIRGVLPGRTTVYYFWTDRPEWLVEEVALETEPGQAYRDVKLEAVRDGLVEVSVTDEASRPLAGAYVSIGGSAGSRGADSDARGVAVIRALPGKYDSWRARKAGYVAKAMPGSLEVTEQQPVRLAVSLKRAPLVRGVARDQAGEPVAGAKVRVFPHETATTADDGTFEVTALSSRSSTQPSEPFILARDEGRSLAAALPLDEARDRIEVVLAPAVTLRGQVVDPRGEPVAHARISLTTYAGNVGTSVDSTMTGADGRYEIKALPAGRKYELSADARGFATTLVPVWLTEGIRGTSDLERVTLRPANLSVSGMVLDEQGKPMPGIQVSVKDEGYTDGLYADTDKDGRFTIDGLGAGDIVVSAGRKVDGRWDGGSVDALAGDTGVTVILGGNAFNRPRPGDAAGEEEANARTLDKLRAKRVSPKFQNISFADATQYIRDMARVKVAVSYAAMAKAGVSLETPPTLDLKDVTVEEALQAILKAVGGNPPLGYTVRNGTVYIELAAAASQPASQPAALSPGSINKLTLEPQVGEISTTWPVADLETGRVSTLGLARAYLLATRLAGQPKSLILMAEGAELREMPEGSDTRLLWDASDADGTLALATKPGSFFYPQRQAPYAVAFKTNSGRVGVIKIESVSSEKADIAIKLLPQAAAANPATPPAEGNEERSIELMPASKPEEFRVMGDVERPGVYVLAGRKVTVKMAIASAGLEDPKTIPGGTLIRHTPDGEEQVFPLNIAAVFAGEHPDIYLKPDDVVVVGPQWPSAVRMITSQPASYPQR